MPGCFADTPWEIYASRAISAWGDRMWLFAMGLFMVELSPNSLKWPAIYGLVQSIAIIVLGPVIGRWVDRTPRLKAARQSLLLQNSFVLLCAVGAGFTFYFRKTLELTGEGWPLTAACSGLILVATLSRLASVASSVIVDKDWVVVVAAGDKNRLARMNSTFRSIDLTTYIVAPIAVGQIMYFLSHIVAAACVALWNLLSFFIEFYLLWTIYKKYPALAVKESDSGPQPESRPLNEGECEVSVELPQSSSGKRSSGCCHWLHKRVTDAMKSWRTYFAHRVRNAGLGLACLYMTVLGFDTITTGYAYSQGVSESILGILTAVGAVVGLLGSLSFPHLLKRIGVERTGLYGFGLEVACLTLCVASVWSPGSPFEQLATSMAVDVNDSVREPSGLNITSESEAYYGQPESYISVILLMTGIVSARFGLWVADLSVTQAMQEEVEENIRGAINGVQSSLNMTFDTLKFVLVIALPSPSTFGYLVCASFAAIFSGWCFFASYARVKRGHLLPFHRILNAYPAEDVHELPRGNAVKKDNPVEGDAAT